MPRNLAVLEARWEARGNYGVRQLFELVSAVVTSNPHAHRYDMFSDGASFRNVLRQIGASKRFQAIYVGSHGERSGLRKGPDVPEIIDSLRESNQRGHIRGMFFGVCSLGQRKNVHKLLAPTSRTNLQWVAGYSKDVEWLESAAADLLFWSGYLHSSAAPLARARQGTKNLIRHMPKAKAQLGFDAFKWSRNRDDVESLMNPN